jgi:DNA-binding MarR family transcriptional regulator
VFELVLLLGADARAGLERMGLTASRAHLLLLIAEHGPSSQRELADLLEVTPRTVTALVDGLESTGFVTREPDPTDRRVARVTMTRQGQSASRAMLDGRRKLAHALLGRLPPEKFHAFDAGLRDVLEQLRVLLDAPRPHHRPHR